MGVYDDDKQEKVWDVQDLGKDCGMNRKVSHFSHRGQKFNFRRKTSEIEIQFAGTTFKFISVEVPSCTFFGSPNF